jgi:acetyl-CoA carboxylase alpha subunit
VLRFEGATAIVWVLHDRRKNATILFRIALEALEVPIVQQAIGEYRRIVVSPDFHEIERLRREALSNEAAALRHARQQEAAKWQGVVADKDAEIARLRAMLEHVE